MTFPRDHIARTISAVLSQELLEVVCAHTGRNWRALTPEAREGVLQGYASNIERGTEALTAIAMRSYEAGVQTAHHAMTSAEVDPAQLESAITRAMAERKR